MNFKVGDTVRFLNTTGEGVIVKIVDSNLVEVKDESGFNIPVLKSELVLIPGSDRSKDEQPKEEIPEVPEEQVYTPEEDSEIVGNELIKLYCALVPANGELSRFNLYLINDCNYHFLYNYSEKAEDENYLTKESGTVEANTKVFLDAFSRDSITGNLQFCFQGVFFKKKAFVLKKPVQLTTEFSAVKLFKQGAFRENDFFNEDALVRELYAELNEDIYTNFDDAEFKRNLREKEISRARKNDISKKHHKNQKDNVIEVDLHIHELIDNEQGLTPADKLDIQLRHFEEELNNAIRKHAHSIVFIHGVGNGTLKIKIRNILDRNYSKLKYQDASFEKYKFGATLVKL